MKIIIAGAGKVGVTLTRLLNAEGYELTLIDVNQNILESVSGQYDIMVIQGNCASMEVLKTAGIEDADLLIAATSADEVNLLCCMTAHRINEKLHTIARIRNPEYTEQIYTMRDAFGLSLAVNPEKQAATEIERLLQYPGFLKRDTFAKGRVEIVELKVEANSKLCNVALIDVYKIVKCKILVCSVLRNGEAITPTGNFVLQEGDRIFVTASSSELAILLKNLGVITHKAKKVIICGGSKIGYYLADMLQKNNIEVVIIERDLQKCETLAKALPEVCIVQGDACDERVLDNEGLTECDALITLTGMDEMNIIMSLYGNQRQVPQVITKLGRFEDNSILGNIPLGSIVCPKELCSYSIVRYVRAMKNQVGAAIAVHSIADGHAEALEFQIDSTMQHIDEPLKNLKVKKGVLIACITHGMQHVIPNGNSSYKKGDTVIVVTSSKETINQFNDIFE